MWISYLATGIVLTGVYWISKPRLRGQYLMLLADGFWAIYAIKTGQWALLAQSIVLFSISCSAVSNWRKERIRF